MNPKGNSCARLHSNTVQNNTILYLEEVANLSLQENSLMLNISKTKENTTTAEDLHTTGDYWDCCGEGEQIQVPESSHRRGSNLNYTH